MSFVDLNRAGVALMEIVTPAQHRQWARILQSNRKPEKARRHEELARVIEIVERRPQQQEQT